MLKSLDILIGLVVVLLALSMAVTLITQLITTSLNSRGRHLRRGLIDMLRQLDPSLTTAISQHIATQLLTHPLVSGSRSVVTGTLPADKPSLAHRLRNAVGGVRLGNVIHREEFVKLLLALAAEEGTQKLAPAARDVLVRALANNGIAEPAATLKSIRAAALQLEAAHPDVAQTLRQNIAILQEARSDLVAKVNGWFDQTMDRTAQRFTASTRAITFMASLVVAIGLQVDTPALVNRLAADDQLRNAFVSEAQKLAGASALNRDSIAREYQSALSTFGVIRLPTSDGWWAALGEANPFGLLITALLLSLGAPFWYSMLARLLRLRSALAAKDDVHRTARQADLTATAGNVRVGERGDLSPV